MQPLRLAMVGWIVAASFAGSSAWGSGVLAAGDLVYTHSDQQRWVDAAVGPRSQWSRRRFVKTAARMAVLGLWPLFPPLGLAAHPPQRAVPKPGRQGIPDGQLSAYERHIIERAVVRSSFGLSVGNGRIKTGGCILWGEPPVPLFVTEEIGVRRSGNYNALVMSGRDGTLRRIVLEQVGLSAVSGIQVLRPPEPLAPEKQPVFLRIGRSPRVRDEIFVFSMDAPAQHVVAEVTPRWVATARPFDIGATAGQLVLFRRRDNGELLLSSAGLVSGMGLSIPTMHNQGGLAHHPQIVASVIEGLLDPTRLDNGDLVHAGTGLATVPISRARAISFGLIADTAVVPSWLSQVIGVLPHSAFAGKARKHDLVSWIGHQGEVATDAPVHLDAIQAFSLRARPGGCAVARLRRRESKGATDIDVVSEPMPTLGEQHRLWLGAIGLDVSELPQRGGVHVDNAFRLLGLKRQDVIKGLWIKYRGWDEATLFATQTMADLGQILCAVGTEALEKVFVARDGKLGQLTLSPHGSTALLEAIWDTCGVDLRELGEAARQLHGSDGSPRGILATSP